LLLVVTSMAEPSVCSECYAHEKMCVMGRESRGRGSRVCGSRGSVVQSFTTFACHCKWPTVSSDAYRVVCLSGRGGVSSGTLSEGTCPEGICSGGY